MLFFSQAALELALGGDDDMEGEQEATVSLGGADDTMRTASADGEIAQPQVVEEEGKTNIDNDVQVQVDEMKQEEDLVAVGNETAPIGDEEVNDAAHGKK